MTGQYYETAGGADVKKPLFPSSGWKDLQEGGNTMNVPQHIAIILDGNGRWAKAKGMPRNYGHAQGSKNVERICEEAWRMGIKYLTVYAFSTENWNRRK